MSEATYLQVKESVEKPYSLRKLQASDITKMTRIISAIGISEFKNCLDPDQIKRFMDKKGDVDVEAVGFSIMIDVAGVVLDNLPKCEPPLYAFLSGLSGMKEEEIARMGMAEFAEMVVKVVKKEEFRDFIRVVSKLFK